MAIKMEVFNLNEFEDSEIDEVAKKDERQNLNVVVEEDETYDSFDPLESQTEKNSNNNLLNQVVDAVLERMKNASEIIVGVSKEEEASFTKTKYRKPKPGESIEQQEKRLMKQRILQMKNRFLLQLKMPDKAEAQKERAAIQTRLLRAKQKKKETPEEARKRKERQSAIVATSRKRLKELETPEQRAERIAKQNEKKKLKYQMMCAKETIEQRIARKQREQSYRERYKQKRLAIKTGKIRGEPKQKQNVIESSESEIILENLNTKT